MNAYSCIKNIRWQKNRENTNSLSFLFQLITHFFTIAQQPQWAKASSLLRIHDHIQTHHTGEDSSGRVIIPTQRPLPDNKQHSQETDIHASEGIWTHNPSKRTAADLRHRMHGHWNRQSHINSTKYIIIFYVCILVRVSAVIGRLRRDYKHKEVLILT
jgi:hypothetical protein